MSYRIWRRLKFVEGGRGISLRRTLRMVFDKVEARVEVRASFVRARCRSELLVFTSSPVDRVHATPGIEELHATSGKVDEQARRLQRSVEVFPSSFASR